MINDFLLDKVIGDGMSSVVVSARHRETGKKYALKCMAKKKLTDVGIVRAYHERNILKQLNHPYVNPMHFSLQDPLHLYFVTEYTSRGDLYECMSNTRLSGEAIWFYFMEMMCAVRYIHQAEIVYGDLKPENVLIGDDGHVRLTDFGCSVPVCESSTAEISGTPMYFAPEMVTQFRKCQANDVWALGVICYELYMGRLPWYNHPTQIMYKMIPKIKLCLKDIPENSKEIIEQMTVVDDAVRCTINEIYETFVSAELDEKLQSKTFAPPYIPDPIKVETNYFDDFDAIV